MLNGWAASIDGRGGGTCPAAALNSDDENDISCDRGGSENRLFIGLNTSAADIGVGPALNNVVGVAEGAGVVVELPAPLCSEGVFC